MNLPGASSANATLQMLRQLSDSHIDNGTEGRSNDWQLQWALLRSHPDCTSPRIDHAASWPSAGATLALF